MSNATELTSANFDSTVASGITLVDFWAQWCQPCLMMGPALDELSVEYEGKAIIGKINVDNEGELAQKFGVSAIPTLVVLNDGQEVKRFVGVTRKEDLAKALDDAST